MKMYLEVQHEMSKEEKAAWDRFSQSGHPPDRPRVRPKAPTVVATNRRGRKRWKAPRR